MAVLQALKMDRSWGPHFKVPAGTVLVLLMLSGSISIALIDKCLTPLWLRLTSNSNNPSQLLAHLRRIGIGHVLNVLGMVVSALVESKRLRSTSPLPVAWLFPQLILVGIGEAFHLPAHVALYYQEFPESLKGSATAMVSMIIGVAFYLSTGLINAIRRSTGWLPQDINDGRLDLVFWILVATGVANFGYFVICARCYYGQSRRLSVEGGVGETKPWSNNVNGSGYLVTICPTNVITLLVIKKVIKDDHPKLWSIDLNFDFLFIIEKNFSHSCTLISFRTGPTGQSVVSNGPGPVLAGLGLIEPGSHKICMVFRVDFPSNPRWRSPSSSSSVFTFLKTVIWFWNSLQISDHNDPLRQNHYN